jgi:hypothetical protein
MDDSRSKRPYDSIPRTGKHQDIPDSEHESGMNVRAPLPPDDDAETGQVARTYQLEFDRGIGCHRVRTRDEAPVGDECDVIGRYQTDQDLISALHDMPERPNVAVFEDAGARSVYMEHLSQLSDSWVGESHFDQVTFFQNEEDATRYAEQRQREMESS